MIRNDSRSVSELFDHGVRDWTPPSALHAACVLYMPISFDQKVRMRCASVLSDAELEKADRFLTEDLKNHFIQRRAFRRYCGARALRSAQNRLSRIVFEETEKGRPYLPEKPNVWFSFSACRFGFLAAWSSTQAIGIDIEDQTKSLETTEIAQQFFSEQEAKAVEEARGAARVRIFFQLWSLKEAALKSIGEGLPFGLNAFEFALAPNLRIIHAPGDYGGTAQFSVHIIKAAKISAALVTRNLL
jgi:phosphopantetheine--protein transferase-like protein